MMSVQPIVELLEKITTLHQGLLKISEQKTESLTNGKIDHLQDLLKQESKHVQAINQLETKRMELVEKWANEHDVDPKVTTVSVMLDKYLTGSEKEALEQVSVQLADHLVQLRQQEQLNQQLTRQSLQFVQLSMDMIAPTIQSINYNQSASKQVDPSTKRSLFDSKA